MTKNQSLAHTPGPWAVHDGGRAETGWGDMGPSICADHDDGTCEPLVEFCGGVGHVEANARLIAAAPAMYEALREFVDWFTFTRPGVEPDVLNKCRRALNEASQS